MSQKKRHPKLTRTSKTKVAYAKVKVVVEASEEAETVGGGSKGGEGGGEGGGGGEGATQVLLIVTHELAGPVSASSHSNLA